jgi:hypothetical protein
VRPLPPLSFFSAFFQKCHPNLATSSNQLKPPPFAMVTNPTAAWDRGENI